MEIIHKRSEFTELTTIGEYLIDGVHQCYILEDKDRGFTSETPLDVIKSTKDKYPAACAIPYGRYEVVITWSNKFQIYYPLIDKVNGYLGIRIHRGYNQTSSAGCHITGKSKGKDVILQSKEAFYELFEKLLAYKTSPEIAKQLIELHKSEKAGEFKNLYEAKKNANKIWITITK